MILIIIIVILSLIALLALHEFGHFIAAKKLGVEVEEFGIGYPPRIIGKKFGETIYSLNWLPFGAFVRIKGEEGIIDEPRSFSQKPIWQRMVIILGGVVSFWIIAFIIFSLMAGIWGLPTAVDDDFAGDSFVQIIQIVPDSPAKQVGIKPGDYILSIQSQDIDKVSQVQDIVGSSAGEINVVLRRGDKEIMVKPVVSEGMLGIGLVRASKIRYNWHQSIVQGAKVTVDKTIQIPVILGSALVQAIKGEKVEGIQLVGPVGIGGIMTQALQSGVDTFLMFVAMIAVWLALVNMIPIPALDGGKMLFLIIEAIRRKPVSQKIEQSITATFFILLIALMIFVTIKDIINLF